MSSRELLLMNIKKWNSIPINFLMAIIEILKFKQTNEFTINDLLEYTSKSRKTIESKLKALVRLGFIQINTGFSQNKNSMKKIIHYSIPTNILKDLADLNKLLLSY